MNTITKEQPDLLEAAGAAGTTAAFRLAPFDEATVTVSLTNVGVDGDPDITLQATNETDPDPTAVTWITLVTQKKVVPFTLLPARYYQYRFSHAGGAADDALSYHLFRWRLR